jgi:hypothetical protein
VVIATGKTIKVSDRVLSGLLAEHLARVHRLLGR